MRCSGFNLHNASWSPSEDGVSLAFDGGGGCGGCEIDEIGF